MTLGIGIFGRGYVAVVTDRRLTGAVSSDDSSKAGVVAFSDAQLVYTLAGFAAAPELAMTTSHWLAEELCAAGEGGVGVDLAMQRLVAACSAKVNNPRIQRKDRRLDVLFIGFTYSAFSIVPMPVIFAVSNYSREADGSLSSGRDAFAVERTDLDLRARGIVTIGSGAGLITEQEVASVIKSIESDNILASSDTAAAVVAAVSARDRKGGVSANATSIVQPNGWDSGVITRYHADGATRNIPMCAVVEARYGNHGAYVLLDPSYSGWGDDDQRVLQVPVVGRNQLCPCGSGKRYRSCHRRRQGMAGGLTGIKGSVLFMFRALPEDGSNIEIMAIDSGPPRLVCCDVPSGATEASPSDHH